MKRRTTTILRWEPEGKEKYITKTGCQVGLPPSRVLEYVYLRELYFSRENNQKRFTVEMQLVQLECVLLGAPHTAVPKPLNRDVLRSIAREVRQRIMTRTDSIEISERSGHLKFEVELPTRVSFIEYVVGECIEAVNTVLRITAISWVRRLEIVQKTDVKVAGGWLALSDYLLREHGFAYKEDPVEST